MHELFMAPGERDQRGGQPTAIPGGGTQGFFFNLGGVVVCVRVISRVFVESFRG